MTKNVQHKPNDHALHSERVRSRRAWRLGFRGPHILHKGEETLYEWDFVRRKLYFSYIYFFSPFSLENSNAEILSSFLQTKIAEKGTLCV